MLPFTSVLAASTGFRATFSFKHHAFDRALNGFESDFAHLRGLDAYGVGGECDFAYRGLLLGGHGVHALLEHGEVGEFLCQLFCRLCHNYGARTVGCHYGFLL